MKKHLVFFVFLGLLIQKSSGQNCHLVAPDSIRTVPHYNQIFQGDTVVFVTYGGSCDSSSWFALYGEECCVTRLDSNKTGVFTFVIWASDIFYSRIENFCDTTWGASIDIDAYPKVTSIEKIALEGLQEQPAHYDLLGRIIPSEAKGFYIIKKRLFFK